MNLKNLNIVGLDGFEKLTICPFVRLPGIYLYKVCLSSVCMFECIFKKHSVLSVAMICFDKVPNIS